MASKNIRRTYNYHNKKIHKQIKLFNTIKYNNNYNNNNNNNNI